MEGKAPKVVDLKPRPLPLPHKAQPSKHHIRSRDPLLINKHVSVADRSSQGHRELLRRDSAPRLRPSREPPEVFSPRVPSQRVCQAGSIEGWRAPGSLHKPATAPPGNQAQLCKRHESQGMVEVPFILRCLYEDRLGNPPARAITQPQLEGRSAVRRLALRPVHHLPASVRCRPPAAASAPTFSSRTLACPRPPDSWCRCSHTSHNHLPVPRPGAVTACWVSQLRRGLPRLLSTTMRTPTRERPPGPAHHKEGEDLHGPSLRGRSRSTLGARTAHECLPLPVC